MKKIPVSQLNSLFAAIAEKQTLYLPVDDTSGQSPFPLWEDGRCR